jgi:hypothetical protein
MGSDHDHDDRPYDWAFESGLEQPADADADHMDNRNLVSRSQNSIMDSYINNVNPPLAAPHGAMPHRAKPSAYSRQIASPLSSVASAPALLRRSQLDLGFEDQTPDFKNLSKQTAFAKASVRRKPNTSTKMLMLPHVRRSNPVKNVEEIQMCGNAAAYLTYDHKHVFEEKGLGFLDRSEKQMVQDFRQQLFEQDRLLAQAESSRRSTKAAAVAAAAARSSRYHGSGSAGGLGTPGGRRARKEAAGKRATLENIIVTREGEGHQQQVAGGEHQPELQPVAAGEDAALALPDLRGASGRGHLCRLDAQAAGAGRGTPAQKFGVERQMRKFAGSRPFAAARRNLAVRSHSLREFAASEVAKAEAVSMDTSGSGGAAAAREAPLPLTTSVHDLQRRAPRQHQTAKQAPSSAAPRWAVSEDDGSSGFDSMRLTTNVDVDISIGHIEFTTTQL